MKKEIKLTDDQKGIIVNLLIRKPWNLGAKGNLSYMLSPNMNSIIYVRLFKESLSNYIIQQQFNKTLENIFKSADETFSRDYWNPHFLSGNSINIKDLKELKPVDPVPLAKKLKRKNIEINRMITSYVSYKKYTDFMGHLRTLEKDD